jgi:hypothetical protein
MPVAQASATCITKARQVSDIRAARQQVARQLPCYGHCCQQCGIQRWPFKDRCDSILQPPNAVYCVACYIPTKLLADHVSATHSCRCAFHSYVASCSRKQWCEGLLAAAGELAMLPLPLCTGLQSVCDALQCHFIDKSCRPQALPEINPAAGVPMVPPWTPYRKEVLAAWHGSNTSNMALSSSASDLRAYPAQPQVLIPLLTKRPEIVAVLTVVVGAVGVADSN